jgi:peptidoglycan-associated lipoprotein|tara:strand:+ start:2120 stop:2746 length:627 start_codon:yes stop_codon:yes gene_type:complete
MWWKVYIMKKIKLLVVCGIWVGFSFGCSKKEGPNPEDTVLIKSGGRNTFMNGDGIAGRFGNDDVANGGDVINNEWGDEGLVLQDSSWGDDDALQGAERPFEAIYFGFDQYNVGQEERPKLQQVAEFMQINRDARILIEGHCDWKGTPAYNMALGDRRASSIQQYLIDLGCDANRIDVRSMGDVGSTPNANSSTASLERKAQFLVQKDS